ncbi:hypothetical protein N7452_011380 [Penicillium brevicompactum]|uniref:Arm-like repeat domain-containing protein n=1 Tax=Penicillium brevicompactum TaxID=5074 RepID=A0A9W9Q638_PENBR|nr:hypothetical protein N7452_011380 [Penicillium brevicompactum]
MTLIRMGHWHTCKSEAAKPLHVSTRKSTPSNYSTKNTPLSHLPSWESEKSSKGKMILYRGVTYLLNGMRGVSEKRGWYDTLRLTDLFIHLEAYEGLKEFIRFNPGFPLPKFFRTFDREERDKIREKFDKGFIEMARLDSLPWDAWADHLVWDYATSKLWFIDFRTAMEIRWRVPKHSSLHQKNYATDADLRPMYLTWKR